ncbi:MoaF N-terminal domain-containing protein [Nocardia sp. NPDC056100]|uniref:MoaF-related domain-containing protein n=1 Tax=Nocardia sp. NPDC056100 TaxID=3345712 RepID=UPI0035DE7D77
MGRTLGIVALMAVALAAAACAADPAPPHKLSPSESAEGLAPAAIPAELVGKTVQLTYDSGSGGTATFGGDGRTLTYVAADTGRKTTSPVAVAAVEPGIFLVTWTDDASAAVISQVQDFRTGKVRGTWSRQDGATAPVAIETRSGSVHLID